MWYKDAIIYELHVKSYYDSNNDGIGDFRGLTEKLDYLADLGVTALWLLPFYPSPLRDDGYDIADYQQVHPGYGTLQDFRHFLREAHRRELKVITELVINHTSEQHPWFQRSRNAAPGSPERNFYVWSDSADRYTEARIIFKDYETSNWSWDPAAAAYYWHRFYSHQPDLNFDNPLVRREIFRVLGFWFEMGVDGMRLDAVPYLFEREGSNCENLPETHAFLKSLRAHLDGRFPGRMLLAEANQWPEEAAAYFGDGDESHLCYHFPVMPRLYMALTMEDRFPIVDIMDQTPPIPESCQWAMFLRNHDELTLEMVTDEERDHMYRIYARDPRARLNLGIRRRLAPLLGNDRRKIELMNILLFSFPGTPILYYGDEIGMGDNYYLGDRDGVRTPMQWSADRNAGFSRAGAQQLYLPVNIDPEYHYEALNVETQAGNTSSLLWWMKRLISVRRHYPCLSRGVLEFLYPENARVLAFTRSDREQTILVVANLSRFHQVAELDLGKYGSHCPREVFSQNRFPDIDDRPYRLTLGPYGFLWLSLEREAQPLQVGAAAMPASRDTAEELSVRESWTRVLRGEARRRLESSLLPAFLKSRPWYAGGTRTLKTVRIAEEIRLNGDAATPALLLEAEYGEESAELYLLPLAFAVREAAREVMERQRAEVICRLSVDGVQGLLHDAGHSPQLYRVLIGLLGGRKKARGSHGELGLRPGWRLRTWKREAGRDLPSLPLAETRSQADTSIVLENRLSLKLYRHLEDNPDTEVVRFLSDSARFPGVAPYLGSLEYRRPGAEALDLCLLQEYVPNQGDVWTLIQNALGQYFERVLTAGLSPVLLEAGALLDEGEGEMPFAVREAVGSLYLELAEILGRRTAEMHRCLASGGENSRFAPEPFTRLYQRSLYQSLRSRLLRTLGLLEKEGSALEPAQRSQLEGLLAARQLLLAALQQILEGKIGGQKIRIHGDYRLERVLFTGQDFLVIGFEGQPDLAPSARRLKYSPLRDVADMIRSFCQAACGALWQHTSVHAEDRARLEPYALLWYCSVSRLFLRAYTRAAAGSGLLPEGRREQALLLRAFLLDKGLDGLLAEVRARPERLAFPVRLIESVLGSAEAPGA